VIRLAICRKALHNSTHYGLIVWRCFKLLNRSDLSHAAAIFSDLYATRVITCFQQYLRASKQMIPRAQVEERMIAKLEDPAFLADVRPPLSAEEAKKFDDKAGKEAFAWCSPPS